jgi:hypothetical protein
MKHKTTLWRWWAKALGEKASKCDKESDRIAIIRSIIFATYLITNLFIIAGVIRHWNKNEIPGCILQIEEGQQTGETGSNLL